MANGNFSFQMTTTTTIADNSVAEQTRHPHRFVFAASS
jgi:hypothetical protein